MYSEIPEGSDGEANKQTYQKYNLVCFLIRITKTDSADKACIIKAH